MSQPFNSPALDQQVRTSAQRKDRGIGSDILVLALEYLILEVGYWCLKKADKYAVDYFKNRKNSAQEVGGVYEAPNTAAANAPVRPGYGPFRTGPRTGPVPQTFSVNNPYGSMPVQKRRIPPGNEPFASTRVQELMQSKAAAQAMQPSQRLRLAAH